MATKYAQANMNWSDVGQHSRRVGGQWVAEIETKPKAKRKTA